MELLTIDSFDEVNMLLCSLADEQREILVQEQYDLIEEEQYAKYLQEKEDFEHAMLSYDEDAIYYGYQ